MQAAAQELCNMVANYKGDLGEFDIEIDIDYSDDWNDGWVFTPDKDISFEHCGRPAYWETEGVFCSKCNVRMSDRCKICENELDLCGGHIGGEE